MQRSGRELAARVGRSPSGVQRALELLVDQGLVAEQVHRSAHLYALNREHVGAPVVLALADLRGTLLTRFRDRVATWDPAPVHVSMFGSAARRDGSADSDLDVLIVRPGAVDDEDAVWRAQLAQLADDARRWTGNDVQLLELGESELASELAASNPTLADIQRDEVHLGGARLASLVRRLRR